MAKFKVGDKVTFKANLEVGSNYGELTYQARMNKLFGECLTVNKVDNLDKTYKVNEFDGWLSEEMLILWSDLTTMDIVQIADRNGKTYITGSMRYNSKLGFHVCDGDEWRVEAFNGSGLSYFIHIKNWKECKTTLTLEETKQKLEAFLGTEVEIID